MIEIIVVRDPDGDTDVTVFIDGVRVPNSEFREYELDAGRGYTWDDWREGMEWELEQASSPAVRQALIEAYADPPGYQYIEGKPDDVNWLGEPIPKEKQ